MKKLIIWNEKYEIDRGIIDEQHKKLIELINELYAAFIDGNAQNVIKEVIDELVEYTKYHFKEEESMFERINYPERKRHKKEHTDFVDKVSSFRDSIKIGKLSLTYDVMNYLRSWLQNHILLSDKKYISYL